MTDPIDTALLPCPFCGGAPVTFMWNGARQAMCPDKAGMCLASGNYAPVPIWNTRAASQADTARAEGIALGLAMAKAAPTYDRNFDTMERVDYGAWISIDDIPEPPIPPHVAAARVLMDDWDRVGDQRRAGTHKVKWGEVWDAMTAERRELDWNDWPAIFLAALEQIAKDGE